MTTRESEIPEFPEDPGIDFNFINETLSLTQQLKSISTREYFVTRTGVPGFYNLGEKGNKFLWVSGATPDEILKFVREQ